MIFNMDATSPTTSLPTKTKKSFEMEAKTLKLIVRFHTDVNCNSMDFSVKSNTNFKKNRKANTKTE